MGSEPDIASGAGNHSQIITGPPPPPQSIPALCPTYHDLGFCSFGWDCPHVNCGASSKKSVTELFNELVLMGQNHLQGRYVCQVCGAVQDPAHTASAKIGETEHYPYCVRCGNFYFYPHVQLMILSILEKCQQNYMEFKRQIDLYYRRLQAILQPAFMYEAHRWATSRYAWSLTGPKNANEILTTGFKYKPKAQRIISMGSGTGYIEHVFFHSAKDLGHEMEVLAYDSMPTIKKGISFDVKVQRGDVSSLDSLGDMSNDMLLLCWPPFGSNVHEQSRMAYDCLLKFSEKGGDFLIYIGDVSSTGDWRYHEHLAAHWQILEETFDLSKLDVWVPQQMGLIYAGNDSIGLYKKREVPLELPPANWTVSQ